jgi:hypothetical protein
VFVGGNSGYLIILFHNRLDRSKGDDAYMSVTSKGRRWEILHSLWIGWTLTLGLFNWVAFLYVGYRVWQRKWIIWGLIYLIPFVAIITTRPESLPSWLRGLVGVLWMGLWIVSMFHAFKVRKEYLLRLELLRKRATEKEAELKRRLRTEAEGGETTTEPDIAAPEKAGRAAPRHRAESTTTAPSPRSVQPSTPIRSEPPPAAIGTTPRRIEEVPPAMAGASPNVYAGDQLEYKISSSYPFPIAFGFRSLASVVDHRDLYRDQLRIAENILAFLASVSLALLREEERSLIDPGKYWRSGISPGDWREIIALCSKVFVGYETNPLAQDIKKLNIQSEKKGFGLDVIELIRAKNDYKHDRGPSVLEEIVRASDEAQEKLKRCMEALGFFTGYPIRQVEDFNVSRRGDEFFLKCLRYTGDHPSFPQEEVIFHKGLPKGELFLDLEHGNWVPLYPFIVTMTCSHCRAKETYFIDMWDQRRGVARMKSFERGHTMSNQGVSEALSEWDRAG